STAASTFCPSSPVMRWNSTCTSGFSSFHCATRSSRPGTHPQKSRVMPPSGIESPAAAGASEGPEEHAASMPAPTSPAAISAVERRPPRRMRFVASMLSPSGKGCRCRKPCEYRVFCLALQHNVNTEEETGMALTDGPLEELRAYRPPIAAPEGFDEFWTATLARARRQSAPTVLGARDPAFPELAVQDLTFSGFE